MKLGMSLKKGGKAAWNDNFELVRAVKGLRVLGVRWVV